MSVGVPVVELMPRDLKTDALTASVVRMNAKREGLSVSDYLRRIFPGMIEDGEVTITVVPDNYEGDHLFFNPLTGL